MFSTWDDGSETALLGGLVVFTAVNSSHVIPPKSALPTASDLGGHVTPEWELQRNREFLCGNVSGMSGLQPESAKRLLFTGCCG